MTPKNKQLHKSLYLLLALLLIGLIYSSVHYTTIISDLEAKLAKYDSNQQKMEGEFAKLTDEYNSMMGTLSEKDQLLIQSQQNLKDLNEQLQNVLQKAKITQEDLADAKALIATLKSELKFEGQIEELNKQIEALQSKLNKSEEDNKAYKKLLDTKEKLLRKKQREILTFQKDIKEKDAIIKRGSGLRLVNFDIKGIKVRNNGKEVETDKAKKADKMRVSFNINSNNISESGEKELYISLYDSEGKLATFPTAKTGQIKLQNGDIIDYTDYITFFYEKGTTEPVKFDWEKDDFVSGDYQIRVYENGTLIGSETKTFR